MPWRFEDTKKDRDMAYAAEIILGAILAAAITAHSIYFLL
jgi:hypothetical protein